MSQAEGQIHAAIREAEALFEYSGLREEVRCQATELSDDLLEHRIDKLPFDAVWSYMMSAKGFGVWLALNRGPVGRTLGFLFAPRWHLSLPPTTRKVLLSHDVGRTLLGRALLLTVDDYLASQTTAAQEVDSIDVEAMHRALEVGGADAAQERYALYRQKVRARVGLWAFAVVVAAFLAVWLGLAVGVVASLGAVLLLGLAMMVRSPHPLWGDIRFERSTEGGGRR